MNHDDFVCSQPVYDVLIVGAGPVGLATAIALRKRGINNILVIDQTRDFRRVGQSIDLLPNGLKAIKYIDSDAYQQVKETAFKLLPTPSKNNASSSETSSKPVPSKRIWNYKNLQGQITLSLPLDFDSWCSRYGEGRLSLPWYDLQTTLRSLLPPEIVRADCCCINLQPEKGWVQIDTVAKTAMPANPFAHWEKTSAQLYSSLPDGNSQALSKEMFAAKLVVGADGINSTIRQLLYSETDLKEWAKPQYSGFAAIGCLSIDSVPNLLIEELEANYLEGERVVTINSDISPKNSAELPEIRLIILRQSTNSVTYLLHAPLSLDLLLNKSPEEIINLAIDVVEKACFPPVFTKLIGLSTPEKLIYRPYYIQPANIPVNSQPIWSRGRVVLVGDAAHAMPPFTAQGANQGLEDAALIATLITNIVQENRCSDEEAVANAFQKYEEIRRPFMEKMQALTMKNNHRSPQEYDNYAEIVFGRSYSSSDNLGVLE